MLNNKSTRNLIVILVAILAVVGLGIWTASAQGPDDDGMPWGRGHMGQPGMMGRGSHHMDNMWGQGGMGNMMGGQPLLDTLAETLNLEAADLIAQLQSGKTLIEIAAEQGIETEALESAILAERQAHLDAMVEQGYMTQDQADAMLSYMTENMAEHLNWMLSGNHRGRRGGW